MDTKKQWWTCSVESLCKQLATDLQRGLTDVEAQQRVQEYGPNALPEAKRVNPVALFLAQFSNIIVWILIGALVISGILGEWIDAVSIGVIVLINAVIGFAQEYHAEKALKELQKLTKPSSRVIRSGSEQAMPSQFLVPGDVVLLEAGDYVPADGRVIQAISLATQEASLTGESTSIIKTIEPIAQEKLDVGDRKNMVFMGTTVVNGKGRIIVTETAQSTQLGSIAVLLQSIEEGPTPLQNQLTQVGHRLIACCMSIVAIIFLLGLIQGSDLIVMLLITLSLAVAAIPEGLPALLTITLSLGVKRMARRHALIRRLSSVETLGCTTVICTDKTGTLTKNEMVVKSVWVNNSYIDITGIGYKPEGEFLIDKQKIQPQQISELMLALRIGVLCNGATLVQKDDTWNINGDPTEGSLLVAAQKAGLQKDLLEDEYKLLKEIPFDSERKRMSMVRQTPEGKILYVKGAPDVVLQHSKSILVDGQEAALDNEQKENVLLANKTLAQQALRVLGLAYRRFQDDQQQIDESLEQELIFVGLIAMIDPPRPEAQEAIKLCKQAGINIVMITGDHKETAIAIAKEINLFDENAQALSGSELDTMNDVELKKNIEGIKVYARVTAQHKLRIVTMLKSLDHVVAVTGDGVNDAPAIKAADIGIAMGITGTQVTKEASDMVITDDNFASIVSAIQEGRGIYDNLIKFINYLVSSNIAELLIIFIGTLFGFTDPTGIPYVSLLPIHLLWLNLVTDGLPAIALGVDPLDPRAMSRPPRNKTDPIFSVLFVLELLVMGCIIALGALVACHVGLATSAVLGHTMALTAFVVLEFARVYLVRLRYHTSFFSNPWLLVALLGSFMLHLLVVYDPRLQQIFKTTALDIYNWLIIGIVAVVVWLIGIVVTKCFEKLKMA